MKLDLFLTHLKKYSTEKTTMNDEADDWELFDLDEGEVVVVEAAKKEIKCIHVPKSNSSYVKNK